jgi:hypothetical protein
VLKNGVLLRLMALVFAVIYYPYKLLIHSFKFFHGFRALNCVAMLKRKQHQMTQCEYYLRILKNEKIKGNQNPFDFHLYKLAIYAKFSSLLTQMVLDIFLGCLLMLFLYHQADSAWVAFEWVG